MTHVNWFVFIPALFTFVATATIQFLASYLTRNQWHRFAVKAGKYKIHHSVLGLLLMVISFWLGWAVFAVGMGIYVSHGFEEMILNKVSFPKAFFVFVTRGDK